MDLLIIYYFIINIKLMTKIFVKMPDSRQHKTNALMSKYHQFSSGTVKIRSKVATLQGHRNGKCWWHECAGPLFQREHRAKSKAIHPEIQTDGPVCCTDVMRLCWHDIMTYDVWGTNNRKGRENASTKLWRHRAAFLWRSSGA